MSFVHKGDELGDPDLRVAGLQVWVHNQPHANSGEPYDADWLTVTVHCGESGASVWVRGELLTASAFSRLARDCEAMYRQLAGQASLSSDEPGLSVLLTTSDQRGHVSMVVDISPNPLTQAHRFRFDLDQSYLPGVSAQCCALLVRFPDPHAVDEHAV